MEFSGNAIENTIY